MTKPDDAVALLQGSREQRDTSTFDFEMRASASDSNKLHFTGYAALFDSPARVGSGPLGPFQEMIHRNAFDKTLSAKPDLVLRTEHRNLPIARTTANNLRLSVDTKGLLVDADLDRRDSDVAQLEVKMENGNLNQMSYVFRAVRDRWNDDYSERELLEVNLDKGDVSIVTYGANENTSARMGSMAEVAEALNSMDFARALTEARSLDNPYELLREMRGNLDRLLREVNPKSPRTMSLAEAEELLKPKQ